MHRARVLELLRRYLARPLAADESANTSDTIRFVEENTDCLLRSQLSGHLTASAWIVSLDRRCVLLTHHRKLDKWLQLGGHADGDGDLAAVALREAREESGLTRLRLVSPEIFDVDRHWIPQRANELAHWHYDLRFMIEADPTEAVVISDESKDLAWIELTRVVELNPEESMARMVRKSTVRSG